MKPKYIITLLYVFLIVLSNYLSTAIIFDVNNTFLLKWGTLTFGAVFFLSDLLHKYGRKYVYSSILLGVIASVIYNYLSGTNYIITAASALALLLGAIVDTELFDKIKTMNWATKAMRSNLLSVPLFAIIYNVVAFSNTQFQDRIIGFVTGDFVFITLVASFFTFVYYFSFKKGEILNFHN